MGFLAELSSFLHSIPEWLSSFITALIGALVGGLFTLFAVDREIKITRKQEEKDAIELSLIHISEPTRLLCNTYYVF